MPRRRRIGLALGVGIVALAIWLAFFWFAGRLLSCPGIGWGVLFPVNSGSDSCEAFSCLIQDRFEPALPGFECCHPQRVRNALERDARFPELLELTPPVLDQHFDGDLRSV